MSVPCDPEKLLAALDDPLARLATDPSGEPDLQRLWVTVPPLVGQAFIGGRLVDRKPLVRADGTVADIITDSLRIQPGDMACYGDLIPACIDLVGCDGAGRQVRRTVFALPDPAGAAIWWAEDDGQATYCCHAAGATQSVSEAQFEASLEHLISQQAAELASAAEFEVPPLFRLSARIGVLRALNTFVGQHPKYGWGGYEGNEHDGFPPTIISLTSALLDVGLVDTAQELFGAWLTQYVRPNGSIDYYGPSLSEHGMLLDLGVRAIRMARDPGFADAVLPALRALADALAARYRNHGDLLAGIPEADYHADAAAGQAVYYGNNLWCARGLSVFGAYLGDAGGDYRACGHAWRSQAQQQLADDVLVVAGQPDYVPAARGARNPPPSLTADRESSYINYRFWPEMLSSRLLTPEQADAIFAWRRQAGGEACGTTRFVAGIDDWPAMEVGLALLDHDRVAAAQRLLVGHIGLAQAAGHQTAYEQVSLRTGPDGYRQAIAGHCVPAQVVGPRLLRNLLVHEAADGLWLNRAGLRAWLTDGYGVSGVTTPWGTVAFSLRDDGDGLEAEADLSNLQATVPVRFRLRRRDGRPLERVEVNGRTCDVDGDTLTLPQRPQHVRVRAW